nr:hypothetical protein [Nostoc sp. ZfuVER08]
MGENNNSPVISHQSPSITEYFSQPKKLTLFVSLESPQESDRHDGDGQ